jgi:hypothetical protein
VLLSLSTAFNQRLKQIAKVPHAPKHEDPKGQPEAKARVESEVTSFRCVLAIACLLCSAATVVFTVYFFILVARNGDLGDGEALVVFPGLLVIAATFGVPGAFILPKKKKRIDPGVFS